MVWRGDNFVVMNSLSNWDKPDFYLGSATYSLDDSEHYLTFICLSPLFCKIEVLMIFTSLIKKNFNEIR